MNDLPQFQELDSGLLGFMYHGTGGGLFSVNGHGRNKNRHARNQIWEWGMRYAVQRSELILRNILHSLCRT